MPRVVRSIRGRVPFEAISRDHDNRHCRWSIAGLVWGVEEDTIAAFLAGCIDADELRADLRFSVTRIDTIGTEVAVRNMDSEFRVSRDMALRVCDAAISGLLPPEDLRMLAFIVITSDQFMWGDDELVAEVLHDWSCPEVNYALTPANLLRFRCWLDGTDEYPPRPNATSAIAGELVSRIVRKRR